MIASDQLQRKARLMELDEKFVDVIVKRYIKHTGNKENCYLIRNGKKTSIEYIPDF